MTSRPTETSPEAPAQDVEGTARTRRPLLASAPTPRLRLLTATQFAFNIGFYAVLPYLATHLGSGLGMAGWLVGLVLGLRTFSQQGLFVIGGALTDRYGPRPVVLAGCGLRIAGFGWLAFAGSTATVIAAVLLIGFAAALFSPAVESEAAREAVRHERATGEPRAHVLALFSAAGQAGAFLGPLLGSLLLLLGGGFRAACLAGAVVFVGVLAAHARLTPRADRVRNRNRVPEADRVRDRKRERAPDDATRTAQPGRSSWQAVFANRAFLLLCLAYSSYLVAYNQLYLSLPVEVQRATGSQAALGWLFALSSLLVVAAQVPLTRWSARRIAPRTALVTGLAVVAAGFRRRTAHARRARRTAARRRARRPADPGPDAAGPRRPRPRPGPGRGPAARPGHRGALLRLRARRARGQRGDRRPAGGARARAVGGARSGPAHRGGPRVHPSGRTRREGSGAARGCRVGAASEHRTGATEPAAHRRTYA